MTDTITISTGRGEAKRNIATLDFDELPRESLVRLVRYGTRAVNDRVNSWAAAQETEVSQADRDAKAAEIVDHLRAGTWPAGQRGRKEAGTSRANLWKRAVFNVMSARGTKKLADGADFTESNLYAVLDGMSKDEARKVRARADVKAETLRLQQEALDGAGETDDLEL